MLEIAPSLASLSMTDKVRHMTCAATNQNIFSREILSRGAVSHDNYAEFMARQLHGTLRHALGHDPRYAKLLDRIQTADARAVRQMANNETGHNYSRWLPGARSHYRRQLTMGHYMTAIADELRSLSREAAQRVPSRRKDDAARDVERALLQSVADFLNEFKRSVRSASLQHVADDYSDEEACRYEARGADGSPRPGQEQTYTGGVSTRVGAGFNAGVAKLSLNATLKGVEQSRMIDDLDRDKNNFQERDMGAVLEGAAVIRGMFTLGANAGVEYQRGRYYEAVTAAETFKLANLANFRRGHLPGHSPSARRSNTGSAWPAASSSAEAPTSPTTRRDGQVAARKKKANTTARFFIHWPAISNRTPPC
jgi:hypothetical protein